MPKLLFSRALAAALNRSEVLKIRKKVLKKLKTVLLLPSFLNKHSSVHEEEYCHW